MKLLIDNNISHRVCSLIEKSISGNKHVSDFHLDKNTDDAAIWLFTKNNGFTILAKDNDFEAMSRLYSCPPKVIQLICGNKKTSELIQILEKNAGAIKMFDSDSENCLMYLQ